MPPFCVKNLKIGTLSLSLSLFENWPKVEMPKSLWLTLFATKEETIWKLQRVFTLIFFWRKMVLLKVFVSRFFNYTPVKIQFLSKKSQKLYFFEIMKKWGNLSVVSNWARKWVSKFKYNKNRDFTQRENNEKLMILDKSIQAQQPKIESYSNIGKMLSSHQASHWVK